MDLKKAYYYIICLVSLFVLLWGAVDLTSATVGLAMNSGSTVSLERSASAPMDPGGEPMMDMFYQKKMLYDRLWDSLARVVVAGLIFGYSRVKVSQLES